MNYWMANPNWGREYSLELAWDPHRYKTPDLGLLAFPACQSHTHISFWEIRRSHYKSKRNHFFFFKYFGSWSAHQIIMPTSNSSFCLFCNSGSSQSVHFSSSLCVLFLHFFLISYLNPIPLQLSSSIAPAQLMISLVCICAFLLHRYIIQSSTTHRPS